MAHTAGAALQLGVKDEKLAAVWDFRTSPLFSAKERAALEVALAGAAQPIVEIVAVIAMFGFMNRWNDSMATPLEEEPIHVGETHLAQSGWAVGKHQR
jgi:alkylhydroperoxidase family enzyme